MANQGQYKLNVTFQVDSFEDFRNEKLDQISPQFIEAKRLLQDISEPRHRCLEELAQQTELINWLHEALEGTINPLVCLGPASGTSWTLVPCLL